MDKQWSLYKGALLLNYPPPYRNLDISIEDAYEAVVRHRALFARWTSDWDVSCRTEWWYCIRDGKMSLESLTAKQRYRVKRGLKENNVQRVTKLNVQLCNEMCDCAIDAFAIYPKKYRPKVIREDFVRGMLLQHSDCDIWICRNKADGVVTGYGITGLNSDIANLSVIKTRPQYLKTESNAALAYTICAYYLNECGAKYVCDGERNIVHETEYQNFLVRVLGFRYAYCRLHVVYSLRMLLAVKLLYPFRVFFKYLDEKMNVNMFHKINAILKQESIVQSFRTE